MAHISVPEDGEISEHGSESEVTMASPTRGAHLGNSSADTKFTASSSKKGKRDKKPSKYDKLNNRINKIENMLKNMQRFLDKQEPPRTETNVDKGRKTLGYDRSEEERYVSDDNISLFTNGQISPSSHRDGEDSSQEEGSKNSMETLSEATSKGLFDMFGEDALLKKPIKKSGIVLDKSQIEVLQSSYRCTEPNFLTAFSEENFYLFPVDEESEKLLQVPSLDSLVECCLTKRYGPKAAFVKGKNLFSQPAKMIEKITYRGQQAARLGLVIHMYVQQSLGNSLQLLNAEDLDRDKASKMVKDIFAMTTKGLDQIGRSGAFDHIAPRAVSMTDTGLYE